MTVFFLVVAYPSPSPSAKGAIPTSHGETIAGL